MEQPARDAEARPPRTVAELLTEASRREAALREELAVALTEKAQAKREKHESARTAKTEIQRLHSKLLVHEEEIAGDESAADSRKSSAETGREQRKASSESAKWFESEIERYQQREEELKVEMAALKLQVTVAEKAFQESSVRAQAADKCETEVEKIKNALEQAKAAMARVAADRNSHKRKLESLQKDTRKLISSKLQIEKGLQELREARSNAEKLGNVEVEESSFDGWRAIVLVFPSPLGTYLVLV